MRLGGEKHIAIARELHRIFGKLMKREFGEEPLLLLDDVLSELDEKRQDFVLNQISTGQVFITCCEPGRFTRLGRTMEISNGEAV